MARGRKTTETTEEKPQATEAVKPGEAKAAISQNKLKNLLKAKRGAKKETGEINGRIGQSIANAIENDHLHRKAFGWICQLDMMEPEKISDLLDNFEYYLDISGINDRRKSVMRMNLAEKDEEAQEEAANVTKFPTAGNA